MTRNETDLGDECPKCRALSYKGGYCFGCGTYRPTKPHSDDDDLDAAAFMEGTFEERSRTLAGDPPGVAHFTIRDFPSDRSPKRETPTPTPPPEPAKPPTPRVKPSHLLQHPELSIPQLIEMYNRGRGEHPVEQPRTDSVPPPCTPQSSAAVDPSLEPPPQPDPSIQITREPPPGPIDVLENPRDSESLGHFYPYDIVQQPAPIPLSSPRVSEIGSSQTQPALPTKKPQRIFSPFAMDFFRFVLVTALTILVFSLLIRLFR